VLAASFHPELAGDDRLHGYFVSVVGPVRADDGTSRTNSREKKEG
jgi:hypothetical protein